MNKFFMWQASFLANLGFFLYNPKIYMSTILQGYYVIGVYYDIEALGYRALIMRSDSMYLDHNQKQDCGFEYFDEYSLYCLIETVGLQNIYRLY